MVSDPRDYYYCGGYKKNVVNLPVAGRLSKSHTQQGFIKFCKSQGSPAAEGVIFEPNCFSKLFASCDAVSLSTKVLRKKCDFLSYFYCTIILIFIFVLYLGHE
jgi:hypothetical protein